MTSTKRALGAALGLLAGGVGTIAVVSCNGLLGFDGYQESACFPEASCADGTAEASGNDAEAGGGMGDAADSGVVPPDASTRDVVSEADTSSPDSAPDTSGPEASTSDASSFPDGWAPDAGATFGCSQPANGPGLSGGPVWLPPQGGGDWRAQLHDPRWAGGPVTFFDSLSGGSLSDEFDAQYRVVYSNQTFYVSIQVLSDANGADLADAVYFGLTGGTASSGAYLFEIAPDPTDSPVSDPTGTVQHDTAFPIANSSGYITYFTTLNRTAATPTWCQAYPASLPAGCPPSLPNLPAFLKNVATWTTSPGVSWAVTLEVDASAIATGNIHFFFGTRISTSSSTAVLLTSSPQWNSSSPQIGDTPAGASVTDWLPFDTVGSNCPSGITVSPSDVGVWTGSALTNAVNTCPGSTCTNQFRAELSNMPVGSPAFAVRPRIRVADWGSTIADPNAPWHDFGISPDIFTAPPSSLTSDPQWAWSQSGTTATIDYTCAPDGVHPFCPWLSTAGASPYQSMLFEFGLASGISGAGWSIQTPAVYRNMAFGTLSTLSQPARITLKGLEALTGEAVDRDVYLYVETRNMPPHGRMPMTLSQSVLDEARRDSMHSRLLTGDQVLTQAYPTYRVHVYYDSGRSIVVKGQRQKELVPMTPFGFYLSHKGAFYGFTHSLEFLDAPAIEIAPHFYRVHVANEGEFHVRTTITAEEGPARDPGLLKPAARSGAAVAAR